MGAGVASAATRRVPAATGLACCLALGGLLAGGATGPVQAQVLPQVGAPVQLGDLRRTFERAYERQPLISERAWTIVPAIDVEVSFTDNVRGLGTTQGLGTTLGVAGGSGWDVFTTVTPSISVQGSTSRLQGSLFYGPQLRVFANSSRSNALAHNLSANGRATILEDLLYLNAQAFATDQSRAGGLGTGAAGNLARQDRVQTTSFSIGPLLQFRLADYGTVEAGYNFGYLNRTGLGVTQNTPFAPALANEPTITNSAHLAFTSGQEFGRVLFGATLRRINYDGSGVLENAHRQSEVAEVGYAVTRMITVLGEIGHQDIRYGGVTPVRINGLLWSAGMRWLPDPDTTITVRYGRRDGGNSFSFDGTTAPTPRTRISARYSEGVSSGAEELQAALLGADFDSFGAAVDRQTGIPLVLTDNFAGTQGGVSRVRRFSATGALLQNMDSYSLTLQHNERNTLTSNVAGAPTSVTYTTATAGWQRELGPGLRGNLQASYGSRRSGGTLAVTQDTLTFSAGVNYAISETWSTRASYTYSRSTTNRPGFGYDMNLLTVGMRKTF